MKFRIHLWGEDSEPSTVPARVVTFAKSTLIEAEPTVVYTFYANCSFECERNKIRLLLGDPRLARSFFSKVEVTFLGGEQYSYKTVASEQAAEAAKALLEIVLPVLAQDHWPRSEELREQTGRTDD